MATYYVYHAAGGAGTGANWANAYTTLTLAFSGHAAGDTYYVAHDHAESTGAAVTLNSSGTPAAPTAVICVNRAGTVPPVSADLRTSATVSTTGAFSITPCSASTYYYGITFRSGSSSSLASHVLVTSTGVMARYENCGFLINNTAAASKINFTNTGTGCDVQCVNCVFTLSSGATQSIQGISTSGNINVTLLGGSVVGGSGLTNLFTAMPPTLRLIGVDLSAFGSGKFLFTTANTCNLVLLQDCKLNASVGIVNGTAAPNTEIHVVRSDSGDTTSRQEKHQYAGVMTTERTIVRSGGGSDGTAAISWKIVTNANSKWLVPFDCPPRVIWNETTGSRTVTIYGAWAGGAVPLDDEIWFDVSYLGTSGFPLALIATTNKADILATGASVGSDASTWGGSIATKFKMQKTITVNEKGPLMVVVKAAKLSSTFYIDPKIEVT